jgi:maltooligosyltrehalose trehalohydrolase
MEPAGGGWFELRAEAPDLAPYAFVLPDGTVVPDPAARRQEWDVHGPSLVCGSDYPWETDWRGRPWEEAVICELHIGTFTPEGTFRAAIDRLDALAETGFTAIEIMPVAQFAGDRGWGYDGVLPFAPHPAYGTPDDLRALVDAAHARGLMVLLDVVYNHFGPEGNYLHAYAGPSSTPPARRPGARASTTRSRPCGASSSRTRSTGSRTSGWTASGSTPSTRSAILRARTCSRTSPARSGRGSRTARCT